jgi:hypothetical protein
MRPCKAGGIPSFNKYYKALCVYGIAGVFSVLLKLTIYFLGLESMLSNPLWEWKLVDFFPPLWWALLLHRVCVCLFSDLSPPTYTTALSEIMHHWKAILFTCKTSCQQWYWPTDHLDLMLVNCVSVHLLLRGCLENSSGTVSLLVRSWLYSECLDRRKRLCGVCVGLISSLYFYPLCSWGRYTVCPEGHIFLLPFFFLLSVLYVAKRMFHLLSRKKKRAIYLGNIYPSGILYITLKNNMN